MRKAGPSSLKNTPYSSKLYECVNYTAVCLIPVVKPHLFVKTLKRGLNYVNTIFYLKDFLITIHLKYTSCI